jgi:hypothetical protein
MPAGRPDCAPGPARVRALVFWFATVALATATALLAPPLEADPDLWGWDVVCHEETALGPPACR